MVSRRFVITSHPLAIVTALQLFWCLVAVVAAAHAVVQSAAAYVMIGQGYGSKWGDAPEAGNGAVVTWGYVNDGVGIDPEVDIKVTSGSDITALRAIIDNVSGAGAFDSAIQRAFDTWSAVANIRFVGPVADSGLPVGAIGASTPNIRIGAFHADPMHWFSSAGAVGFGPPGPPNPFTDFPLSGDVLFNLSRPAVHTPFHIATGVEDVDPVDVFNYGDDLEGLFLHELGHAAIGLDHPPWDGEDPDQRVMYVGDFETPGAPFCCQALNHELHPDDITGAQFTYGIRGDFNRDGQVDAADYVVWRDTVGASVTKGTGADGNVDGAIDAADYDVWRKHFGDATAATESGATAAGAVPEPASVMLLMGVSCAACFWRAVNHRMIGPR